MLYNRKLIFEMIIDITENDLFLTLRTRDDKLSVYYLVQMALL